MPFLLLLNALFLLPYYSFFFYVWKHRYCHKLVCTHSPFYAIAFNGPWRFRTNRKKNEANWKPNNHNMPLHINKQNNPKSEQKEKTKKKCAVHNRKWQKKSSICSVAFPNGKTIICIFGEKKWYRFIFIYFCTFSKSLTKQYLNYRIKYECWIWNIHLYMKVFASHHIYRWTG